MGYGCADGSVTPPICSTLPERWSKVSHAAGELATAFYMLFLFFSINNWSPFHGKCLSISAVKN